MKLSLKTVLSLLLPLCLLPALLLPASAAGEALVLFDAASQVTPVILLSADPSETETSAAETLRDYLAQVTGTAPEVIRAGDGAAEGAGILSLSLDPDGSPRPKGSYLLRAGVDRNRQPLSDALHAFYIEAADARGLFNGVYAFLRRVCGVEILSADVKTVPQAERLAVDLPYWVDYVPTLEYADTDWISPHDAEFAVANGLNGTYSPIDALHGGQVNYIGFAHSLTNGVVPEEELFETHPEYFALTEDGQREPTQLCLSNPEVVARAIDDVRSALGERYDPEAALNIVSVTQDDNQDFCLCESCSALAERYGGQSGLMLWFVNQIAADIEGDYPDVVVDTFAYQYTRRAPKEIVPRENVCVRLCSIECCFAHPLDDPDCEVNQQFMQDLRDWSAICGRLYVWDYTTNYGQTLGLFPDFGVLRENINVLRAHNVVGIYEEGAYYAAQSNTEFADLRAYLLACFMRDEADAEDEAALTRSFLTGYYGGGESADAMGEILDVFTSHAGDEDGHLFIGQSMKDTLHGMTAADIAHVDALWELALDRAGDADAAARIERSRLCWRYYKACVQAGEFKGSVPGCPKLSEMKKLIADLQAAGVTRYNESKTMEELRLYPFFSPADWISMDSGAVPAALVCACVTVLLAVVTALIALRRKHPLCALLLVLLAFAAVPLGAVSGRLFVAWSNLPLYGLADLLTLVVTASFVLIALWALHGGRFAGGKRSVGIALGTLAATAVAYEVFVLIVNNLIYHGRRALHAVTVSSFLLMAVICASLVATAVSLLRGRREKQ